MYNQAGAIHRALGLLKRNLPMDNDQKNETDAFTEWLYTDIVKDHFTNPRNVVFGDDDEVLKEANGVGVVGSPVCGDMMRVYVTVDPETDRIKRFRWKTFGCASAIASTSMLSEMVLTGGGITVDEAFKIRPQDILAKLGGLPERKIHCSVLGDKALREALRDYLLKTGQEERIPAEPERVVCHCLQVSEADIEEAVLHGARSFEQLQHRTKVATGCGQCEPEARRVMKQFLDNYGLEEVG